MGDGFGLRVFGQLDHRVQPDASQRDGHSRSRGLPVHAGGRHAAVRARSEGPSGLGLPLPFSHHDEEASAGYYKVKLQDSGVPLN